MNHLQELTNNNHHGMSHESRFFIVQIRIILKKKEGHCKNTNKWTYILYLINLIEHYFLH